MAGGSLVLHNYILLLQGLCGCTHLKMEEGGEEEGGGRREREREKGREREREKEGARGMSRERRREKGCPKYLVYILHPLDTVHISQVGFQLGIIVTCIGGLMRAGCRGGIHWRGRGDEKKLLTITIHIW